MPRFLAGMRFGDWIELLREHHFRVDAAFVPRAAVATVGTLVTSAIAAVEDARGQPPLDEAAWRSPLIILGIPRSGTTHLFQLMAADRRFCYPTRFDAFHPHTLLTLRGLGIHHLLGLVPTVRRAMDDVRVGWLSPEEDSIAIAILAGRGDRMIDVFPRDDFVATPSAAFETAIAAFTRKLVAFHGRPLILKSPGHVRRIPSLLRVFPGARFVMLHRDPRDVVASVLAMAQTSNRSWCTLQWPQAAEPGDFVEDCAIRHRACRDGVRAIPPDRLVEIRYEDLIDDRAGTLARVYDGLGLPAPDVPAEAWPSVRPRSRRRLDPALERRVIEAFAPEFESGRYDAGDRDGAAPR